jgi:hypothetical protein
MSRTSFHKPGSASRAKVGISVLAAVLTALLAGQIAAAPPGAHAFSIHGVSR